VKRVDVHIPQCKCVCLQYVSVHAFYCLHYVLYWIGCIMKGLVENSVITGFENLACYIPVIKLPACFSCKISTSKLN